MGMFTLGADNLREQSDKPLQFPEDTARTLRVLANERSCFFMTSRLGVKFLKPSWRRSAVAAPKLPFSKLRSIKTAIIIALCVNGKYRTA